MDITQLLAFSVKNKASDLHLAAEVPPLIRVMGEVRRLNIAPLTAEEVLAMVYDIMPEKHRTDVRPSARTVFICDIPGLTRFRVTLFEHRRGPAAIFHTLPSRILTLEQLGVPDVLRKVCRRSSGLIVISGKIRSGRSTTIAAMINEINENEHAHISVLDEAGAVVFEPKKSLISQIEVGVHADSHASAIQAAISINSDVIVTGELRDLEATRMALLASETGHLVIATISTPSVIGAIQRLVGPFSGTERSLMRDTLSDTLVAIISQSLPQLADFSGRTAAHEILVNTPTTRTLIRQDRLDDLYASMESGGSFGMSTLDQALFRLVRSRTITFRTARTFARYPENFSPQTLRSPSLGTDKPIFGFFVPLGSATPPHYFEQSQRVQR